MTGISFAITFEDLYGRRLARTIWAQDSEDFASLYLEVNPVDGDLGARLGGVALAQPTDAYGTLHGHILPSNLDLRHEPTEKSPS